MPDQELVFSPLLDVLTYLPLAIVVALVVVALIVIVRATRVPARERILWAVIVVLAPILGAVASLILVPLRNKRLASEVGPEGLEPPASTV